MDSKDSHSDANPTTNEWGDKSRGGNIQYECFIGDRIPRMLTILSFDRHFRLRGTLIYVRSWHYLMHICSLKSRVLSCLQALVHTVDQTKG